jgi:hypothetical protein
MGHSSSRGKIHLRRGEVPQGQSGDGNKEKNLFHFRELLSVSPIVQLVA